MIIRDAGNSVALSRNNRECWIEIPNVDRSDEQSQQSGQHKAAEQHRPVSGVETQKPTITREAQCRKPLHRDNPCIVGSWFVGSVRQLVMPY
jgi:hypothetical protein